MSLELLLIIAFGGAFLVYFFGKISPKIRDGFAVFVSLLVVLIIISIYGKNIEKTFYWGFLGLPLVLRVNMLSWLFAMVISSIGSLSVIFSLSYIRDKEKTDFYYLMLLLVNSAMLGIVMAGDLASFFVFWEIMSWTTFFIICYKRGSALAAGMKYIIMSIIGSMAMFIGVLSIQTKFNTLIISELSAKFASASPGYILFILITFGIGFGVKSAVVPLHTWLPDAHSQAPTPFSAILSGVLTKMGIYGFILFFYFIIGLNKFLGLGPDIFNLHYILCWVGAITIVIPTFIALLQNDAKRLLAWHSIGQIGYIILGISIGTSMGVASGIFHMLNHATFKALLFLTVGAVEYQTNGVRDLNSLGGLAKRMPVTFIGALIGAFGIIGVPLTNGFVSKWMIYKTLILNTHPFLAFAALLGTWGTILSLFKFVHHIFLGQLPEKLKDIKKAPFDMQFSLIILSIVIILFGILPGIPLKVINSIISSAGFSTLNISIWGIASETGTLNTINIFTAILGVGVIVWLIFKVGRKSKQVDQYDNYAAGFAIPKDKYHYTVEYYAPFYRMATPFLVDIFDIIYERIAKVIENICDYIRKIYTGYVGNYVMYIVFFMAFLILIQLKWSVF